MNSCPCSPCKELGFGVRHTQALLMFLCMLLAFSMRAMMSIAIVAMTSHTSASDSIKVLNHLLHLIFHL